MPFKNIAQVKACFAKNDKDWDCKKWIKETPNFKNLPKDSTSKKKQIREFAEFLEDVDPVLAKILKDKKELDKSPEKR